MISHSALSDSRVNRGIVSKYNTPQVPTAAPAALSPAARYNLVLRTTSMASALAVALGSVGLCFCKADKSDGTYRIDFEHVICVKKEHDSILKALGRAHLSASRPAVLVSEVVDPMVLACLTYPFAQQWKTPGKAWTLLRHPGWGHSIPQHAKLTSTHARTLAQQVIILNSQMPVCLRVPSTQVTSYAPTEPGPQRQHQALLAALATKWPGVKVDTMSSNRRVAACEAATGRAIQEKALNKAIGGNEALR